MPRRLVFQGHPELGDMRGDRLCERPIVANDVLYEHMVHHGVDWYQIIQKHGWDGIRAYAEKYSVREKPLVLWMTDIVTELEAKLREDFFWTFERYMACRWNDPDDDRENIFECGPLRWYVTIRDFESNVVHPKWVIAFDEEYGNFLTARGMPGHPSNFESHIWCRRGEQLTRIRDAIREHQRIRNFRLKRLGRESSVG